MKFRTTTTIIVHGARMALPACPTVVAVTAHEFGPLRRAEHVEPAAVVEPPASPPPERQAARASVEARLRRAGQTLRRLPRPVEFLHLKGRGSVWPTVLATPSERMELEREHEAARRRGQRPYGRARPAAPGPRDIAELDEVLRWLLEFLDVDQRSVVLGKMAGVGFRRLAAADPRRRSKSTLARLHDQVVTRILVCLLAEAAAAGRSG